MRYLKIAVAFLAIMAVAVNISYAAGANKKIKVGVSVATMKEAVYSFMKKAMMDNKDKYNAEIYWVAANNDEMAQVANVEDLLAQGVDVLIIHPVNTVAAGSLVEKARKENVPVISMDRLPVNANVNCHVTANSFLVGQTQAKYLAEKLKGKGNVVILEGESGNDVAREITAGNKDILKNYPGMKIVVEQTHKSWSRNLAMATTENALTNYKNDIQGVLANNSGMIMGAVRAILAEGLKGKIITVGSDADKDSCQAIIDGTNSADVDKMPYQLGLISFETAAKTARGEKVETDTTVQNGKYKVPVKFTPVRLITRENVKEMKDRWPDLKF